MSYNNVDSMIKEFRMRFLSALMLPVAAALLAACGDSPHEPVSMESVEEDGVLRVATRNGATTYYLNRHEQPSGPEYDLVHEFAEAQGWDVEWTMHESTAAVIEALEKGTAHLAASGLTHRPSRNERFTQGPAHSEVTEQLVCHREGRPLPRLPEDIAGFEIRVTASSSYVETLNELAAEHEGITFSTSDRTTEVLLSQVAEQQFDCTVADSNIVQLTRRHWPHLEVAMNLTQGQNLGWYLPAGADELAGSAREWMNSRAGDEAITAMENKYYSYIGEFDFVDLRALNRRIEKRLPQYREYFIQAEEKTGMPAELLAALAYQESHWDPDAVSPTGVRGIMMLTRRTAGSLGVENRLDPVQAIDGGARYLADRHARLPETIPEPDRTFLALASYNIGRGHLLDARQLARDLDRNPDSWEQMRQVLPLKADKRYYPSTRYGYARGYEPVHYVQRIRNYRDVISKEFK
ncbi:MULTISPECIES: membrane-bound lytic murein transglycosylase MltF [Halomonadaceae]|uniref:membrane-bound lytic murein transglycosylase MltF n=1 Tax=Halomonadaceae TaxID=28256 RepID=UPI00257386A0|nr:MULTISPECIES: membrane-bound lytic murein transglycosylase MltF [Halomonas]